MNTKLLWSGATAIAALIGTYFVPASPYKAFDYALKFYILLSGLSIVHVQRKFSSYRPKFRKAFARFAVYWFQVGVYAVGILLIVTAVVEMLMPATLTIFRTFGDLIHWSMAWSATLALIVIFWIVVALVKELKKSVVFSLFFELPVSSSNCVRSSIPYSPQV